MPQGLAKPTKVALIVAAVVAALLFINFLPTFFLETPGMHKLEGDNIDVYYERQEDAAKDVLDYVDPIAADLSAQLGVDERVSIYVYDQQATMQTKRYGLIAPLLGLDWYIGDNIGSNTVILTSPANPPASHSYETIVGSAPHELVHCYVAALNPHVSKWLTEGMALYLANGEEFDPSYLNALPSYDDVTSNNPIRFEECGGYQLANTYVEYLDVTYGWDKVVELVRTEDYETVLGVTHEQAYEGWIDYLQRTYEPN